MLHILGLGSRVQFSQLSEKRVTSALRAVMRYRYGRKNVRVSCRATYAHEVWEVAVWIGGKPRTMRIRKHR